VLVRAGHGGVAGRRQHLKLRHPARPPVLRPRRPQGLRSCRAARQIGAAVGYADAQAFGAAVTAQEPPPDPVLAHDQ